MHNRGFAGTTQTIVPRGRASRLQRLCACPARWVVQYAAEMLIGAGMPAYRVANDPGIRLIVSELACCALEVGSAVTQNLIVVETSTHEPARINVVLISGTVTKLLAPVVEQQWSAVPEPKVAIAVGACASSGGPYWDAETVVNGITELIPASGFIAGCPPRPDVIIDGVCSLVGSQ